MIVQNVKEGKLLMKEDLTTKVNIFIELRVVVFVVEN